MQNEDDTRRGRWRFVLFLLTIPTLLVLFVTLDPGTYIGRARQWIASVGPWGPAAFVLAYVVATVAMVPGTALTVAGGGLFGVVWGSMLVSVGATLGAGVCFLIARWLARDAIRAWLWRKPRFRRLDGMVARRGAWAVAVTRLIPLFPFNLLNYGFGLTGVGFWTYLVWSFLCMIPGTVWYVAWADAVAHGLTEGKVPALPVAVGLVAGIVTSVAAVVARKKLRRIDQPPPTAGQSPDEPAR